MKNNPYLFVEKNKLRQKITALTKKQLYLLIGLVTLILMSYYVLFGMIIFLVQEYLTTLAYLAVIPSIYLFIKKYWTISENQQIIYRHLSLPLSNTYLLQFYFCKIVHSPWGVYFTLIILPLWVHQLVYFSFSIFINFFLLYLSIHSMILIVVALYQRFVPAKIQQMIAWLTYLIVFGIIIYLIYFPSNITIDLKQLFTFFHQVNWHLTLNYPPSISMTLLLVGLLNYFVFLKIFTVKKSRHKLWPKNRLSLFSTISFHFLDRIGLLNYGFFYKDMIFIRNSLSELKFVLFPCLISFGLLISNQTTPYPSLGNIAFLSLWLTSNTTEKLIKNEKTIKPFIQGNFIQFNRMAFEKRTLIVVFVTLIVFIWCSILALFFNYHLDIILHGLSITFFLALSYTQSIIRKALDKEWFSGIVGLFCATPVLICIGLVENNFLLYLLLLIYNCILIILRRHYAHE